MKKVVTEILSGRPGEWPERELERDESQLFQLPPPPVRKFLGVELPPLAVYSFPTAYAPVGFGPPRGVFEGSALRLEWQTLTGRQPFYHRNADVDEIGYQICGERTLITECGTMEFGLGQFARIPVGVAHDNYCRDDIHLIFYLHGPVATCVKPVGRGEYRLPPFPGWEANPVIEALTNTMGALGGVIGCSMVDEALVLDAALRSDEPLEILEPSGRTGEVEWLYHAPKVWIGHTRLDRTVERRYRRYVAADEIQYQAIGSRTLVSQHGVVTLQPGEFTMIPRGCAYASLTDGASEHLSVLVTEPTPPCKEPDRTAEPDVTAWLAALDQTQAEVVQ